MSVTTRLVSAGVAAVAFGAGTLVAVPSQAADPAPQSSTASKAHHRGHFLRHVQYADWVGRNGVHHEAIRGTVKVLSAKSITVRSKNGHTERFTVTAKTVTRILGDGHKGKDAFSDVNVGDRALVVGKGKHVAQRIVARAPKKTTA